MGLTDDKIPCSIDEILMATFMRLVWLTSFKIQGGGIYENIFAMWTPWSEARQRQVLSGILYAVAWLFSDLENDECLSSSFDGT